ncbi:MAG: Glutamine-binding periplasmic protein [Acidimicrobiaceae bacterium]|nr:Glutamine-binding periplasmic protein [Acidimicrobiaceae bacterium]
MTTKSRSRPSHLLLRLLALLVGFTLTAAACGDSDGSDDPVTSPAEETAATGSDGAGTSPSDETAATGLLAELQEAGVVTVGLANEIPYGYEDEDGNILGEAPDVARAVLAELGIDRIEAEVVDFGALIPGLQAGQYDMIAAGMFITPERSEQIIFSDPDYCSTYAFAVAEGNPLGVGGDFGSIVDTGATLAVLSGAVDEDYAADANVPAGQIELFADVNAQYEALLAGRVDAVGGTSLTVLNQVNANDGEMDATPAFVPLDADGNEVLGCGGFGFIDQDFRDAFNGVLRELIADGTVEELVTAYGFAPEEVLAAARLTVADLTAVAATGLLAELQEAGVVTVGLANEIPYGYEDESGNILGEAPDVARAVLAELGIDRIEAEVVDFGALIPGLQAGQYDMIAAGMFITPERSEQIIFSDPDYCSTYAFAVAEGNPLGVGGDFGSIVDTGATLAVLSGAVDEDYAADANIPAGQIELFADVNAQYEALLAGRVDAVGGTSLTVLNQVNANDGEMDATPAFVPLDADGNEVLGCGGFGFIDQDFRDAFNGVLRELIADGTVEELVTAYGFAPEEVLAAARLTVADLTGG